MNDLSNFASDDWHCSSAEIDLAVNASFSYRMKTRDKSYGFDFCGTFTAIDPLNTIEFEADPEAPIEILQQGWQAILNNFRLHTERNF